MTATTSNNASMFDLRERVVLVAGGAGYLGLPTCQALAECGATVVIADKRPEQALKASQLIKEQGLHSEHVSIDLGDEASVIEVLDSIRSKHGRLDAAVNATAYSSGKAMNEMTVEEWDAGIRVTLTGAFVFARESAKLMVPANKGSIVQFGSMYGLVSPDPRVYQPPMNANPVDYGAAKAGICQLVRYQAVALAPPDFRTGRKTCCKSLFYKGGVSNLGVPRLKSGHVRTSEAQSIRLGQRAGHRQNGWLSRGQDDWFGSESRGD